MKKSLIYIAFLGLISLTARAQEVSDASGLIVLNKSDLMVNNAMALSNASSVRVADIESYTTYQRGNGNQLRLNPPSPDSRIGIVQDGNFNTMDLQVIGQGNNYQFSQMGNKNDLQIRNLATSNNTLQVVQRGDGNQLIDRGSGLMNVPMRIEQRGGMKVLINGQ